MGKYKNKLLSIEAVRWNGLNVDEVKNLVDDISKISIIKIGKARYFNLYCFPVCYVRLNEQFYTEVSIGDYIVKDETGNIYTCKEDLFNKIYERVDDPSEDDMGNVSDGYHTFDELYRYRMLYNAAFFNELAKKGDIKVCKSHRHYDGEECFGGGWFIVMAELPTGQISNHYENRHWELFNIPELDTAWEWDGHTPNEAADRIESYLKSN